MANCKNCGHEHRHPDWCGYTDGEPFPIACKCRSQQEPKFTVGQMVWVPETRDPLFPGVTPAGHYPVAHVHPNGLELGITVRIVDIPAGQECECGATGDHDELVYFAVHEIEDWAAQAPESA